jgi:hypothetical protein
MIYTARQLEDMHRATGQIVLPYRARLTPLAKDWLKAKQIAVGYSDVKPDAAKQPVSGGRVSKLTALPLLWWCDGQAGSARAAVTSAAKEISLDQMAVSQDAKHLSAAIKLVVGQLKSNKIAGGVLLVKNAALPVMYANRNAALRAIAATNLLAMDEAMNIAAPNVLVIEHTRLTVQQIKNMILRFARAGSGSIESLQSDLKEMAQCG